MDFSSVEKTVQEKLHDVSSLRTKLLSRLDWLPRLESNVIFHSSLLITTLMIIIAIFAQLRSLKLFAFHPICMTIGTVIFFAEGIVTYKNKMLLEIFSPIMQHNKRIKIRVIHQTLQMTGAAFIGMGLLFMLANKGIARKSILPHTFHSFFGTLALILIVIQGISGSQKMAQFESLNKKTLRWHGDSGLLLWDLLCMTMLLGAFEFLNFTLTNVITELCLVATWLVVHAQMRRKGDYSEEREGEEVLVEVAESREV